MATREASARKVQGRKVRVAALLQQINAFHQTTFTLVKQYADGESRGAYLIVDQQGKRWVLKWTPGANNLTWMQGAKTVTDLLRSLGYPAPSYLLIGSIPEGIYSVQSELPGTPLRVLTTSLLPRLFALNELQRGLAIPGRNDWHQEVIHTVLQGGEGYCLHASLQQHSPETAELLHVLQTLVRASQDEPHRTTDSVHGDFQHANILVQDGQISGIVDWDGSFAGDGVFDIVTLLFYAYDGVEVREQLWAYALERASFNLLSMYLAHLILRQVDWSLRFHDRTTSEGSIHRGQMLLREIVHRSHDVH